MFSWRRGALIFGAQSSSQTDSTTLTLHSLRVLSIEAIFSLLGDPILVLSIVVPLIGPRIVDGSQVFRSRTPPGSNLHKALSPSALELSIESCFETRIAIKLNDY